MADFLKIAITAPGEVENEPEKIRRLADGGFHFVHLRKPGWDEGRLRRLIEMLPSDLYGKLVLHDFHHLADEYGIGGVHANSRNPNPPAGVPFSASCHSVEELDKYDGARYLFLSPVFDSISKPGYRAAFDMAALPGLIAGKKVVALGGVTESKIPLLKEAGFVGAAMLGDIWRNS